MEKYIGIIEVASMVIAGLVVFSSVVVRLTPTKKDDDVHSKFAKYFFKILRWLPTIGVNPQTKELERAYEELKKNESNTNLL